MACTPPTTHSPGYLQLSYIYSALRRHHCRFRFNATVTLTDIVNIRAEANRIAAKLKDILPSTCNVDKWAILLPNGSVYYGEDFTSPYTGTHGIPTGSQAWLSSTIAFEGRAPSPAPGECTGHWIQRIFNEGTVYFSPGMQFYNSALDSAFKAYVDALNVSTYVPADFYGTGVPVSYIAPVQFNAFAQRKAGC